MRGGLISYSPEKHLLPSLCVEASVKGSKNSSAASSALLYFDSLKIHADSVTSYLLLRMHAAPQLQRRRQGILLWRPDNSQEREQHCAQDGDGLKDTHHIIIKEDANVQM